MDICDWLCSSRWCKYREITSKKDQFIVAKIKQIVSKSNTECFMQWNKKPKGFQRSSGFWKLFGKHKTASFCIYL